MSAADGRRPPAASPLGGLAARVGGASGRRLGITDLIECDEAPLLRAVRHASAEARRSLDRTLAPFHKVPRGLPPTRVDPRPDDVLGTIAGQLRERMGVTQPSAQPPELSEGEGTLQLNSPRKAAAKQSDFAGGAANRM